MTNREAYDILMYGDWLEKLPEEYRKIDSPLFIALLRAGNVLLDHEEDD